jgi:hypothetical protein
MTVSWPRPFSSGICTKYLAWAFWMGRSMLTAFMIAGGIWMVFCWNMSVCTYKYLESFLASKYDTTFSRHRYSVTWTSSVHTLVPERTLGRCQRSLVVSGGFVVFLRTPNTTNFEIVSPPPPPALPVIVPFRGARGTVQVLVSSGKQDEMGDLMIELATTTTQVETRPAVQSYVQNITQTYHVGGGEGRLALTGSCLQGCRASPHGMKEMNVRTGRRLSLDQRHSCFMSQYINY